MYNYALKPRRPNNFSNKRSFFNRKKKRQCVKHMVNEYFSTSVSWQKRVLQLFLGFVVVYAVYFFIFSSYFKINNVSAEGNQEIPQDEIISLVNNYLGKRSLLIFSNNNYFLFNSSKLEKQISEKYFLDYLKIKRQGIHGILIVLKEKPGIMLYKQKDREYLIDRDGIVLSDASGKLVSTEIIKLNEIPEKVLINQNEIDEQNKLLVNDPQYKQSSSSVYILEDENGEKNIKEVPRVQEVYEEQFKTTPEIGKELFDKDTVGKLIYLNDSYNKKFSQLKIIDYEYDKSKENFLTIITHNNFKIFFDLNSDIDTQLNNLYKYIVEEKNYDVKNIEYIDLRYENQIIIK